MEKSGILFLAEDTLPFRYLLLAIHLPLNTFPTTESPDPAAAELDRLDTPAVLSLLSAGNFQAARAVEAVLPEIARAVDAVAERMARGGRLIYLGAGTSGRLGVLDASECPPTFSTPPGRVVGLIAGGEPALTRAVEDAEDDAAAGAADIARLQVTEADSVVGISASGRAPYALGGLAEARRRGALTIALACDSPSPLADTTELSIVPLTGPELIAGSTRLKAGTAQKLALNMLSSAVMIRLGKVYGPWMVDLQPANAKLRARARRMVATICLRRRGKNRGGASAAGAQPG